MNSNNPALDTMVFAAKFKKIFSVDRNNKIDSEDLKEMATSYQLKYSGLNDQELILKFSEDFKKYLKFCLEEDKCWYNPNSPQYFLTSLARVGTLSYPIFRGYIPPKKVNLLKPFIEKMIVKIFQLQDLRGFNLVFTHCHKITSASSIILAWGDFTPDQRKLRREERKRERETSRSHTLTLETSPLLSNQAAKAISVPIYDPNMLSQEKMIREIKRDVRKNISKLRADIKKNIAETKNKTENQRKSVELKHMKVETAVNQALSTSPIVTKKSFSSDDDEGTLSSEHDTKINIDNSGFDKIEMFQSSSEEVSVIGNKKEKDSKENMADC